MRLLPEEDAALTGASHLTLPFDSTLASHSTLPSHSVHPEESAVGQSMGTATYFPLTLNPAP